MRIRSRVFTSEFIRLLFLICERHCAEEVRFAAQFIMDAVAKASETLGDSRTRTNRLPFQRQSSAPNRVSSRLRPSPKLNGSVCRTNPHESPFSHTSLV